MLDAGFDAGAADTTTFESPVVRVGTFRCSPRRRDFRDAGQVVGYTLAAGRNAVWIEHEGQRRFVADPTRFTLYNPGQPYRRFELDPRGDRSDWFVLAEPIVREIVSHHDPAAGADERRLLPTPYVSSDAATFLVQRIVHRTASDAKSVDPLYVEESVISLFARAVGAIYHRRPGTAARATRRHYELAEATCAHLNRNFARSETITAIATALGVSPFHLCRVFHRQTGMTIHGYRQQLRLRYALESLERPDDDLLALAIDTGFSGHSHFTSAFRRVYGMVPSRARALLRQPAASSWRP